MPRSAEVRPLGPTAWSSLRLRLSAAGETPSALIGLEAEVIASRLDLPQDRAVDLASLLARVGQLSLELERLQGRGIWMLSREDEEYPESLRLRLGDQSPPVLFGSGDASMLSEKAIGIVGSRDADTSSLQFTERLAEWAVRGGLSVVSGATRGVDSVAMRAAFAAGGKVAGVLAESLEQRIRDIETRRAVAEGQVVFISPYGPATPFSVGAAMGRNQLIYCLSAAVVVVAAAKGSGGTWAGAEEALRAQWVPVVFRAIDHPSPAGEALSAMGAHPINEDDLRELSASDFVTRMDVTGESLRPRVVAEEPMQYPMFGLPVSLPAKRKGRKAR
jgi:predicted Rossmann fold nucleotide-binding protein DprA/Smf involved in DNA uptake